MGREEIIQRRGVENDRGRDDKREKGKEERGKEERGKEGQIQGQT